LSRNVGSKYKPKQRNIPEERRPQPHAASVEEPVWRINIEDLHVMCSGGANSVTKQIDNCVTGNAANSIYRRSKGKGFNLSNGYWIVQELFKAHHSNSRNPIHSNSFFEVTDYVPPVLPIRSQLKPLTNGHTSQNTSLSQITQNVTAISVSSSDKCLSAERR
jgi:hypothetical protein